MIARRLDTSSLNGSPRTPSSSVAILAPSSHNRQPWRVDLREPEAITLYVDRERLPAPKDADEFYLADLVGLRADDRYLIINPFFHAFGLKAGIPDSVPAITVNRVCGSGLTAVVHAVEGVKAGFVDVIAYDVRLGADNIMSILSENLPVGTRVIFPPSISMR